MFVVERGREQRLPVSKKRMRFLTIADSLPYLSFSVSSLSAFSSLSLYLYQQADIQYWDDTLTEECQAIRDMLDRIPSMRSDATMEKAAALDRVKSRLRSAKGTKRSFKMEIRLVQDVGQRRKYEQRLATLENLLQTLQADVKAMETESQRGELFIAADTGNGNDATGGQMDGVKAGDNMLKEASHLQDKTQDSLANTRNMIAQSKEVGVSTLEELERQRGVIENINNETDRINDNLARAEILLKQFGKRMASDHMIQCFAVVNCLLLLGVILYAVLKGGTLTNNGDAAPISPTRKLSLESFVAQSFVWVESDEPEQQQESIAAVAASAARYYLRKT
jgi:novel plant SNARE